MALISQAVTPLSEKAIAMHTRDDGRANFNVSNLKKQDILPQGFFNLHIFDHQCRSSFSVLWLTNYIFQWVIIVHICCLLV